MMNRWHTRPSPTVSGRTLTRGLVLVLLVLLPVHSLSVSDSRFQAAATDWDEFEEEEFVAAPPPPQRFQDATAAPKDAGADKQHAAGSTGSKLSFALSPAVGDWFYVETACLILLVIFGINYYLGCKQNRRIVLSWGRAFAALLESNFSRLGEGGGLLVKESESKYRVPATGRRNCQGLQATLTLSRRHDLFATIYNFFSPSQDTLTVEVALENNVDPFVFAVVPNSRAKSAPKDIPDLGLFAKQIPCPELSEWFTIYAEGQDVADMFLNKQIVSTIAKYHKLVRLIHVSDQFPQVSYKRMLRFELILPENPEEMTTLMRMIIYCIDYVPSLRLSAVGKARADKKRAKAAEEEAKALLAQKQEAAQKKKAEKRAKQKEKLKELPPEQQAKAEEREARRARKKKLGKMGKVKVIM